jgi:anti-sigma regulatory factor (Ser/Thr protein kinase)
LAVETQQQLVGWDHAVVFYEREPNLVATVAPYLAETLATGGMAVVVATASHRAAIADGLATEGIDMAGLGARYVTLDAATLLAAFMESGRPNAILFDAVVGAAVRHAVDAGRPVRVYGEMVDLLWTDGAVAAAIELEQLWNDLGRQLPISLLCAYRLSATGAGDEELGHICGLHAEVVGRAPAQVAAQRRFNETRDFGAGSGEPRAARSFVVGALARHGLDALVDDAALIVSELATNALLHGGTAFSVTVSGRAGRVRLSVRDHSPVLPMRRITTLLSPSGRGLRLVAALAQAWGTEVLGDAKVVWAELRV